MKDDLDLTDTDRSTAGAFVVGLLCGAAVGAAAGLLLAPKTGSEMRRQVAHSADEWRRKATEAYDNASSSVNDMMARGREAIQVGKEAFQRTRPGNGSATDMPSMP
jgi:gas vesicle protein